MIGYTYFVHIWPNLRLSVGLPMCTQYSVFLYSLARYRFLWWSLSFTRRSFFYRGESYICCGYKDKYLDSNLEVHWLRNRTVVGSSLWYMTSLTTSGWLGSQTQAWIILHRVDLKSNYVAVCYCWDISTIVAPPWRFLAFLAIQVIIVVHSFGAV